MKSCQMAFVYSGPNYGLLHRVLELRPTTAKVQFETKTPRVVPRCDVELIEADPDLVRFVNGSGGDK